MMVRPSLSSVSGFGRDRPSRLPMPAARITIWVVTASPSVVRMTRRVTPDDESSHAVHPKVHMWTRRYAGVTEYRATVAADERASEVVVGS